MPLGLPIFVQFSLAFGLAGLFWPEKLLPVFDVLMFPWIANSRTVRINSIMAITLALMLFAAMVGGVSEAGISLQGIR